MDEHNYCILFCLSPLIVPLLLYTLKKLIDVFIIDITAKKHLCLQHKHEVRNIIINLTSQHLSMERKIERILPDNYEFNILKTDKELLNELEIEIDKIKSEDTGIATCFIQMNHALSCALDDIHCLHVCRKSEKDACWEALSESKKEIKAASKNLKTTIDRRYSAPR
ncbi:hypothetical protein [Desulfovibrio falkowii]